jgi:hypothetical protein
MKSFLRLFIVFCLIVEPVFGAETTQPLQRADFVEKPEVFIHHTNDGFEFVLTTLVNRSEIGLLGKDAERVLVVAVEIQRETGAGETAIGTSPTDQLG